MEKNMENEMETTIQGLGLRFPKIRGITTIMENQMENMENEMEILGPFM